jgi:hypothetical protein
MNNCGFLKLIISVMGGHFGFSPQAPTNLTAPLQISVAVLRFLGYMEAVCVPPKDR